MANARFVRLTGTATDVKRARFRQVKGTVSGTVGVRFRQVKATQTVRVRAQIRTMSAGVALAAGAPVVAATAGGTFGAGTTRHLTATAKTSGGATMTSWTWRLISRSAGAPLPVLSASNVQSPTYTAPPDDIDQTYVWGVMGRDSANRQSAEAIVTDVVEAADYLLATAAGWSMPTQDSYAVGTEWR